MALVSGVLIPSHLAGALLLASAAVAAAILSSGRKTTPVESQLVVGVIMVSATTDLPQKVHVGPVTGLGALTIVFGLIFVPYWIFNLSSLRLVPLPLRLFMGWALVATIVHPTLTTIGAQNLLVFSLFAATIGLSRGLTAADPARFVPLVGATLRLAGWVAVLLYAASVALGGLGGHSVSGARAFPPFALVILGPTLSRFRFERRSGPLALALISLIGLGLSRGGLGAAFAMMAVAWFNPRTVDGWVKAIALAATSLIGLTLAISNVSALRGRFFGGDVQNVGLGVSINTTGRETIWRPVWNDYLTSPFLGHGPGSGDTLVARLSGFAQNAAVGVGNVHNDYLRILHDYGAIGLALWAVTLVGLLARLNATPDTGARGFAPHLPWGAFLSLFGIALLMIVDNPMIEVDVMIPLGVVLGVALAVAEDRSAGATPNLTQPIRDHAVDVQGHVTRPAR